MTTMTTHFLEGNNLANAQIMLEACREEAERAGDETCAQVLKGLDAASHTSAELALASMADYAPKPSMAAVWRTTLRALAAAAQQARIAS